MRIATGEIEEDRLAVFQSRQGRGSRRQGTLPSPDTRTEGGGFGLGAVAIQSIQRRPAPVYLITEIDVKDADKYAAEFGPKAQATIRAAGGKFILIGGTAGVGAKWITAMDGTPPKRITVQQWESMDKRRAWYNGADYQAALEIGKQYADFRRYASRAVETPVR